MGHEDIVHLIAAVGAVIAAVIGAVNSFRIQHIHVEINHRMDELLKTSEKAAHAAGREEKRVEDLLS